MLIFDPDVTNLVRTWSKSISQATADTSQLLRKLLPLKAGLMLLLQVDVAAAASNAAAVSVVEAWRGILIVGTFMYVQHGVKTCAAIDALS